MSAALLVWLLPRARAGIIEFWKCCVELPVSVTFSTSGASWRGQCSRGYNRRTERSVGPGLGSYEIEGHQSTYRQHPQRLRLSSKQRIMCSRVCSSATMRRSAVEVRRLFHSSSGTRRSSISSNTVDYGCSARRNYCSPSSSSSIPATAVGSWNQSLLRETVLRARAPSLVLQRPRTFSSLLPQPSKTVTTTTKLSVDGGVMTISLPLPGLPGLTAVSVPVDVPVRDFVNELKALDKRWAL